MECLIKTLKETLNHQSVDYILWCLFSKWEAISGLKEFQFTPRMVWCWNHTLSSPSLSTQATSSGFHISLTGRRTHNTFLNETTGDPGTEHLLENWEIFTLLQAIAQLLYGEKEYILCRVSSLIFEMDFTFKGKYIWKIQEKLKLRIKAQYIDQY